jgi:alpha-tubulin suppressor-like RCC1 family protein
MVFTSISAGEAFSLGINTFGFAFAWGLNSSGQLGNGTIISSRTPVLVCGGIDFTAISASLDTYALGISRTGVAYAWGNNTSGQLGNGPFFFTTPVLVCNVF